MFSYISQNSTAMLLIFIGSIGLVLSIIFSLIFFNLDQIRRRMKQSQSLLPKNLLRTKFKQITSTKVKSSTISNVERDLNQAGFYNASYEDFLIASAISSIILVLFFSIVLNNIILALIFGVVGAMLPHQIIIIKKNKRFEILDRQLGPFLQIVSERYENGSDMKTCIETTVLEFKGEQPIYKELERLALSLNTGKKIEDMLDEFAERLGNPYAKRFADYYRIATELGSDTSRGLVTQAFMQHDENRKNKILIQKELQACKSEGYLLLGGIPAVVLYQMFFSEGYVDFMINTTVGKVGLAIITIIAFGAFWFLNKKIGAPLK